MIVAEVYYAGGQNVPNNYAETLVYYDKELTKQAGIFTNVSYTCTYSTKDLNLVSNNITLFLESGACCANYAKVNRLPVTTITTYAGGFNNDLQLIYKREYLDATIRKITLSTLD